MLVSHCPPNDILFIVSDIIQVLFSTAIKLGMSCGDMGLEFGCVFVYVASVECFVFFFE